jgi:hypothetical protein
VRSAAIQADDAVAEPKPELDFRRGFQERRHDRHHMNAAENHRGTDREFALRRPAFARDHPFRFVHPVEDSAAGLDVGLEHELADKGVRVQVVLPGATGTGFWADAGLPVEHLPSEIVMPASEMVDAALAGLDQGEFVTIPSLPDAADWHAYEAARQNLVPNLSHRISATRYRASAAA